MWIFPVFWGPRLGPSVFCEMFPFSWVQFFHAISGLFHQNMIKYHSYPYDFWWKNYDLDDFLVKNQELLRKKNRFSPKKPCFKKWTTNFKTRFLPRKLLFLGAVFSGANRFTSSLRPCARFSQRTLAYINEKYANWYTYLALRSSTKFITNELKGVK